jgi:hypothetical protein
MTLGKVGCFAGGVGTIPGTVGGQKERGGHHAPLSLPKSKDKRKLLLDVARTPDTGLSVPFPTAGVENRADDSRRWDRVALKQV